ncbi:hypothetical protein B0H17DRAFT_1196677 [Mycena rosella]|uniref:Uncharacterized protein n=1 Tax=Mycena rosella TaxID=1033263 RepID=A0AAD7DTC5_MYCRO|nr:hypothetical protein B0H17DRAFT_1196677 [Mycena rosella]
MEDSEMLDAGSPIIDANELEPQTPQAIPTLDLLDQQRLSLYILTQRDRPIPSLNAMKEFLDLPEDVANKFRVEELNEQHGEDLLRLYAAQADDYIDDAEDRYYSLDEYKSPHHDDIEARYSDFRKEDNVAQPDWDYAWSHTMSTYQTRLDKLEITPAELDFPQSIEEYRSKPREMQQRIARFLLLETDDQREKMLTEFSWAWRQVTALRNEFQMDAEFQEELRASIVELNSVVDPRKR